MKHRSLVTSFFLSIFLPGIYGIYWVVALGSEIGNEVGEDNSILLNIVLIFLTLGIWLVYLIYKYSKYINTIAESRGEFAEDYSTLALILCLTGCGFLAIFLIQDKVNGFISDNGYNRNVV